MLLARMMLVCLLWCKQLRLLCLLRLPAGQRRGRRGSLLLKNCRKSCGAIILLPVHAGIQRRDKLPLLVSCPHAVYPTLLPCWPRSGNISQMPLLHLSHRHLTQGVLVRLICHGATTAAAASAAATSPHQRMTSAQLRDSGCFNESTFCTIS